MITYKQWRERTDGGLKTWFCEGWYLFGLIPLLIRRVEETAETQPSNEEVTAEMVIEHYKKVVGMSTGLIATGKEVIASLEARADALEGALRLSLGLNNEVKEKLLFALKGFGFSLDYDRVESVCKQVERVLNG